MDATSIIVPTATPARALERAATRAWTWGFLSGDLRANTTVWQEMDDATALSRVGAFSFGQPTPGLRIGAGSAQLDHAVTCGLDGQWVGFFPNPTASSMQFRLLFRDPRLSGTSTYLDLQETDQSITIRRAGNTLELRAAHGLYLETAHFPFTGQVLLDVVFDPGAKTFRAFINGIDLTPSFTGSIPLLQPFGGPADLALLNNVAGTSSALGTSLVFAGIRVNPTHLDTLLSQHRADAELLVRADGLCCDPQPARTSSNATTYPVWTRAWSPNRMDPPVIDVEPPTVGQPLSLTGAGLTIPILTAPLQSEGLGRARLHHAFGPTTLVDRVIRTGFPTVDDDLHVRLIFKIAEGAQEVQTLVSLTDSNTPSLHFAVRVDGMDLLLEAPSAYGSVLTSAVALGVWHLLDVSLDRDNGSAQAQFQILLDGVTLPVAAHTGLVADIPAGAIVALFDDAAGGAAATYTALAFVGFGTTVLALDRHILDSVALA